MNRLITFVFVLAATMIASARTAYVVWQNAPITGNEEWIKSNYYIWESTYTQANVGDALEFTPTGKGWIGGGYESVAPFNNKALAECQLVFDVKTTGTEELSVQLTSIDPKVAQSVKLSFPRNGEWQIIHLKLKKDFPKIYKAWSKGANGYIFSIIGGATPSCPIYLRNIRYEFLFQ